MFSKKDVHVFGKTRTSFFENTYVNSEKHVRVFFISLSSLYIYIATYAMLIDVLPFQPLSKNI